MSSKTDNIILLLALIIFAVTVNWTLIRKKPIEGYRDALWTDASCIYNDRYRTSGSIYGTPSRGWNLFSGVNFYPTAY